MFAARQQRSSTRVGHQGAHVAFDEGHAIAGPAEGRALVDLVIDVIKAEVKDDATRDRIARAIFERAPSAIEAEAP